MSESIGSAPTRLREARQVSFQLVLQIFLLFAFCHALFVLALGLNQPLLDMHYFRQTQTALTSYWLLKGGPWLTYETPVLGAPWAIPFEFPIYQLLAAALSWVGVPLNAAGRIVAFGFFLGSLWPMRLLFQELKLGSATYLSTAVLFLVSPIYLYWSRTFLVESCAVFFALLWLALFTSYLCRGDWLCAFGAIAAGSLAALAKSTTFPAFLVIGGLGAIYAVARTWFLGSSTRDLIRNVALVVLAMGVPLAVGFGWVAYSDSVKSANEFGRMLTSSALSGWNFGNLQQKLGTTLWFDTVRARVIPDTLGSFYLLAFVTLGATLTATRSLMVAGAALVGFAVPFLVFTNLHIVHNYYQVANAIFIIAAIGFGVGRIFDSGQRFVALLVLTALAGGQLYFFYTRFAPEIGRDYSQNQLLRISEIARGATKPGQSLIVIGDDWASTVPYHAERKALTIAAWAPAPLVERVFAAPQSFLADAPLGGIVYCADRLSTYNAARPAIQAFIAGRSVLGAFGECQLLSSHR